MKLLFRQRFLSFFDSYDIYDEYGEVYFKVVGKLAWGHKFHVYDRNDNLVAILNQRVLTLLPRFDIFDSKENLMGTITKRLTLFIPRFDIDMNGWEIEGNFMQWDYCITKDGNTIATISKQIFRFMDTYVIDVDEQNALCALLVVVSIDAIKCSSEKASRNND